MVHLLRGVERAYRGRSATRARAFTRACYEIIRYWSNGGWTLFHQIELGLSLVRMPRENVLQILRKPWVWMAWTRRERVKGGLSVGGRVGMLWELMHLVEGRLNRCIFEIEKNVNM